MGVGVHPRRNPDDDVLDLAGSGGGLVQQVQLVKAVHSNRTDAVCQGVFQFIRGLVVAVERNPL